MRGMATAIQFRNVCLPVFYERTYILKYTDYNFAECFVWVCKSVSHIKLRTRTRVFRKWDAEEKWKKGG
jgi:hypothetical protein